MQQEMQKDELKPKLMDVPVLCSLCPEWDTRYPIGNDFFGSLCCINGVPCCEVCYNVYHLTHPGVVE
jgi:hypothetical protein